MGRSVRDEKKTEYLKFRVSEEFKAEILKNKESSIGSRNIDLQQYLLRLIELGIYYDKMINDSREEKAAGANDQNKTTESAV